MKTKPILFSTEMVQAILEGRKMQTRRVIKGLEELQEPFFQSLVQHASGLITFSSLETDKVIEPKNPYGNVGDILWVREKFKKLVNCETGEFEYYSYYADMPLKFHLQFPSKHKPSIHMPKEACRLFLKITNVRVERLWDISEEDSKAEGCSFEIVHNIKEYKDYLNPDNTFPVYAKLSFISLWEKINGVKSLEENPFVWVIEFERIEKPENF